MKFNKTTEKHLNLLKQEIDAVLTRKNIDNTQSAANSLEVVGNKLIGNSYIYYLDQGRGPGKFPPVNNIRDWVRQKLNIEEAKVNGVAFLVGRKIATEGTAIYNDKSKGIELDNLIDKTINNIIADLPNEVAVEAFKWL